MAEAVVTALGHQNAIAITIKCDGSRPISMFCCVESTVFSVKLPFQSLKKYDKHTSVNDGNRNDLLPRDSVKL